ncbi:hypothetical protein EDB85DRAFT_2210110 [Lactarius pseudohatsudake]|nr:hypothetical protein EDB85DRAFT_2210110 [Lactarius pseudohatsudake]
MTIGEVLPQYSNISNQPKVPVLALQSNLSQDQHWLITLDSNGIIGPNGKAVNVKSNAIDAPTHNASQLVAGIDTGFTLPQVPSEVAHAMYSGAKGAKLKNLQSYSGDIWVIDCDAEVNVTFLIGGQSYHVHPSTQIGKFQPLIAGAEDSTYDMILGMAWLTNVYLLIDYGDFVDGTTNTDSPYIQLLPMTDPAAAHAEFVATRLFDKHKIPILATAASAAGAGALLL